MPNSLSLLFLAALCCMACGACTLSLDSLDPDELSSRVEEVLRDSEFIPVDLNGDGYDERVRVSKDVPSREHDAVILREHDGQLIDQVNYARDAQLLDELHFLDTDGDEILEVMVPYIRNDSLFLNILDAQANDKGTLFLVHGAKRQVGTGGTIDWDPRIRDIFLSDVNRDGREELVTVIATQYASTPRGVWVHSYPDGELIDKLEMGANPNNHIYREDFDGDGRLELLFGTGSANNEASVGGTDDQHAYLMAVELADTLHWDLKQEMGGTNTDVYLRSGDLDGNGTDEWIAFPDTRAGRLEPATLQVVDLSSWIIRNQNIPTEPLIDVEIIDLNRDGRDKILVLDVSGGLFVLNERLEPIRQKHLIDSDKVIQHALWVLPDADGDGIEEIFLRTATQEFFLDPSLDVKAVAPSAFVPAGAFRRGVGQVPYLYARQGDDIVVFRLQRNRWYLVHRFGPWLAWLAGISIALSGLALILSIRRKKKMQDEEQQYVLEYVLETDERGWLRINPDGQVKLMNQAIRLWLDDDEALENKIHDLDTIRQVSPSFFAFLNETLEAPDTPHERTIHFKRAGHTHKVRVATYPLLVKKSGQCPQLVQLKVLGEQNGLTEQAPELVAKKVVRDIKTVLATQSLTANSEEGADAASSFDLRENLKLSEQKLILATLDAHDWYIQETADALGIDRTTLWKKMRQYGIRKQRTS